MKKIIMAFCCSVIILNMACLPFNADSQLFNNIAHADIEPVLDASCVPDSVYGNTVVMYVRSPMLDDVYYEDLSEFSGFFYSVWREGKLFFYLNFKKFFEGDSFKLLFDLEDSNAVAYGIDKTASVSFLFEKGKVSLSSVESIENSASIEDFTESATVVSGMSDNSCIVELVLDFSTLYEGYSFDSNKRIGFDIIVSDSVDGGTVRYVWNDDTGNSLRTPDSLGTFEIQAPTLENFPEDESFGGDFSEDRNPGTCDDFKVLFFTALSVVSLCGFVMLLRTVK